MLKKQLYSSMVINWVLTEELLWKGVNFKVTRKQFLLISHLLQRNNIKSHSFFQHYEESE